MKKTAVIFDMDGVIVDSENYNQKVLSDFFDLHTEYNSKELHLTKFIGSSGEPQVWEEVFKDVKHNGEDFIELDNKLDKYMDEHPVPYKEYVMPYSEEILKWLKINNYKVGLASSSPRKKINKMLKETGFDKYFQNILSGEDFVNSKPNPDIYNTMVKNMNIQKEDCVVIEDSFYGIQAGINAEIDVIVLKDHRFNMNQSNGKIFINDLIEIINILSKKKED